MQQPRDTKLEPKRNPFLQLQHGLADFRRFYKWHLAAYPHLHFRLTLFACAEQLTAQPLAAIFPEREKDIFDTRVTWTSPWLRDSLPCMPEAGEQGRSRVPSPSVPTHSDYWLFPRTLKRISAN